MMKLRYLTRFREKLITHFNEEEQRTLSFDLGVDYESLPARGRAGKARELVGILERNSRIRELVTYS